LGKAGGQRRSYSISPKAPGMGFFGLKSKQVAQDWQKKGYSTKSNRGLSEEDLKDAYRMLSETIERPF